MLRKKSVYPETGLESELLAQMIDNVKQNAYN